MIFVIWCGWQNRRRRFLIYRKQVDKRAKESPPITDAEMDEISRLIEEEREANYQEKLKNMQK